MAEHGKGDGGWPVPANGGDEQCYRCENIPRYLAFAKKFPLIYFFLKSANLRFCFKLVLKWVYTESRLLKFKLQLKLDRETAPSSRPCRKLEPHLENGGASTSLYLWISYPSPAFFPTVCYVAPARMQTYIISSCQDSTFSDNNDTFRGDASAKTCQDAIYAAFTKIARNCQYRKDAIICTGIANVYGVVQCAPDLSLSQCQNCLSSALANSANASIHSEGGEGIRSLMPSCCTKNGIYPLLGNYPLQPRDSGRKTNNITNVNCYTSVLCGKQAWRRVAFVRSTSYNDDVHYFKVAYIF
ncbi:hypothetical protein POM88_029515 [Heracleum sosnowskyi]|uniref:Gnk2-homologous domain-containing protein n=1 Tax=Heracleum sosnowskyi TaxID=360622 RepID=A0AAD8MHT7_9APIA|nr:hypothetical protein POM88_029515 [Heracleum sosnowskyi]